MAQFLLAVSLKASFCLVTSITNIAIIIPVITIAVPDAIVIIFTTITVVIVMQIRFYADTTLSFYYVFWRF
ncbi:hypothetical protein G6F22_009343 [Rhizopus arrhizus]|nr:hypothetical protein G6F22_009343 [Rhizopus arrhizus]